MPVVWVVAENICTVQPTGRLRTAVYQRVKAALLQTPYSFMQTLKIILRISQKLSDLACCSLIKGFTPKIAHRIGKPMVYIRRFIELHGLLEGGSQTLQCG